jgi:sulfur carrier protein ThiS
MKITLKLFTGFRRHLPARSRASACELEVAAGSTVGEVLTRFDVPMDGAVILVNGRTAAPERALEEGDVLAAFPAMAGG